MNVVHDRITCVVPPLEMQRLLGDSMEDQKRRVQEKLALRRRLMEEREAEGLAVDEGTMDELVEEEDKRIRRRVSGSGRGR